MGNGYIIRRMGAGIKFLKEEYNCPCCEEGVGIYNIEREEWSYQNEYCPECGQHISWEGIDSE